MFVHALGGGLMLGYRKGSYLMGRLVEIIVNKGIRALETVHEQPWSKILYIKVYNCCLNGLKTPIQGAKGAAAPSTVVLVAL